MTTPLRALRPALRKWAWEEGRRAEGKECGEQEWAYREKLAHM